jgi:sulfoxide reductase heme-binding subunit YedZ
VTAILGVIHYYWLVKSDVRLPLLYAFLVGILLAWRVGVWFYDRRRKARADSPKTVKPTPSAETA